MKIKSLLFITALLSASLMLVACSTSVTTLLSSSESVQSSSNPQEVSVDNLLEPPAQLVDPDKITIYTLLPSELYQPQEVKVTDTKVTLNEIITAIAQELNMNIPIRSITQQKGMVIIDFDTSFIEENSKRDVYTILNSIASTLKENHQSYEWLQPRLNGEIGILSGGNPNGNGEFIPLPLKLISNTTENFTTIRETIPYEGLREVYIFDYFAELDPTGKLLADFISRFGYFNEDISSPQEISTDFANYVLILNTRSYSSDSAYNDPQYYKPQLKALEAYVAEKTGSHETVFWLKEHIDETAKLLFGENYKVTHRSFSSGYIFCEPEGVYTPPHRGGDGNTIPIIFSYEDKGDSYVVECALIISGMGGYMAKNQNGEWFEIDKKDIKTYAANKADRMEFVLKKTADGGLNFVSCNLARSTPKN